GSYVGPAVTTQITALNLAEISPIARKNFSIFVCNPARSWFKLGHRMSKIVGIDLGTTNSLVATVDSGIPLVIADAESRRLTPSVVHVLALDVEPIVGVAANRVRVIKPAETVYSVKRFIGRRGAEILPEETSVTYPLDRSGNGPATIPIHGRNYSPEE